MTDAAPAYVAPALTRHRRHLRTLFDAFAAATGWPPSFVGFVARGEKKWAYMFEGQDFTHRSYDTAVSRLSALWPEHAEWPADVPRQAPATDIPQPILDAVRKRSRVDGIRLPGGMEWPADIPAPGRARAPTTPKAETDDGEEAQGE